MQWGRTDVCREEGVMTAVTESQTPPLLCETGYSYWAKQHLRQTAVTDLSGWEEDEDVGDVEEDEEEDEEKDEEEDEEDEEEDEEEDVEEDEEDVEEDEEDEEEDEEKDEE
ncbi:hypothetical protein DPEC_G00040500 [Dallia pectoralis]|uniref:Uncharacterized protein n=1 Tax=Dallia pectoralis TaxID=75939 RepID=A0ACC2HEU9_DALPE|nr:hypothetical protein DPEC_G00040500 [Dallia pectoralis]